jgi:hypothetical protein
MARPSLKANVKPSAKDAAEKAAQIAGKLSGVEAAPVAPITGDYQGEMETVSYNLPVELIELYRDLAEERLKIERAEKRAARRKGEKPPQARRSASALVREALEAYRPQIEAELKGLRGSNP